MKKTVLALGLALALAAHSSLADTPDKQQQALTAVMLGELAIEQNQYDAARNYYVTAMSLSNDPNVAKRVVYLAMADGKLGVAVQGAQRWAQLQPQSLDAQLVTMDLLLKDNQATTALIYIQQALGINPIKAANAIVGELQQLPVAPQQNLLSAIDKLPNKQKNTPSIQFIKSLLQYQTNQPLAAIDTINKVLKTRPDWSQAVALKAEYLVNTDQLTQALQFSQASAKTYPKNAIIQLVYAEVLLKAQQVDAAKAQLQQLVTLPDSKGIALLMLAQLALKQQDMVTAKQYLQQATADPAQASSAYYLLGQIYEFERKNDEAIKAYQQVQTGENYMSAQLKAVALMMSQGHDERALNYLGQLQITSADQAKQVLLLQTQLLLNQQKPKLALQVLNRAITAIPNDIDLLYARSMVANQLNQPAISEQDLKQIIALDPRQATALNALAYLLIKTPNRYPEALQYTQQALSIEPNNPAVLDTMGWLQYHMGNYKTAYKYLQKAYHIQNDGVIAAHYGEILWKMGQQPEAKEVWQSALQKDPHDPDLLDAIAKFKANTP
jgi:tetratricopeptide (TPR) repeat protein